jgi:hypothetical protein
MWGIEFVEIKKGSRSCLFLFPGLEVESEGLFLLGDITGGIKTITIPLT